MNGKVTLITGGTRGIGKGLVEAFVSAGSHVAFTYRSSHQASDELIGAMKDSGVTIKGYASDAADYTQAEALVKQVLEDFGTIDVLINNAGITRDTLMLRMSEEQWDEVIHTNLKSAFNLTKQVLRPMMKARSGSIINMSSVVGVFGNAGQANYAASKAGLIGFTKSIAKELGSRNIRCNAIAPGFIETEMTGELSEETMKQYLQNIPLNRLGKVEDVAKLALFLASDDSSYITGQVLSVCGGLNI
ncbi:MAG: 3-oxoacyl-[acyl-carrier-protein] reductase [Saprospiraceae bacterium]|nr:3-oxoacyl-[acyl-carrier-protein] reductase [Saprospiraceae bacterium]MCB9318319.1 3-oxoacyl-[acyl-carrier-protein] reductase [Lewinellaceae bacterium]